MRRVRNAVLGAVLLSFVLFGAACAGPGGDAGQTEGDTDGGAAKGEVTVGSDSFAEAQIVGEMYALVLENAGYTVERQLDLESREVRLPAMENGEIDVAPEYLASLYSVLDAKAVEKAEPGELGDPEEVRSRLEPLLAEKGLAVLDHSDVIDTNALVVTQETAEEHALTTTSDLADVAGDLTLGAPPECPERPFCIPGFEEVYGIEFGDFKSLEYGATITALSKGAIDVGLLYSTDGTIAENNFVVLEDDKGLQAADNITPLVTEETAGMQEVVDLINSVTAALETDAITELNKRANVDVEDPADLAQEYLEEKGLL
ncbi:MAG TPA: ABC transporter substrate-binding protein [Actinomycetota bacterium]|nr:ABC transporter substrate-binding protein [Actinomycetota bacterium]